MAAVLIYHVVGDLTVGKPELKEFPETSTVAEAITTLRDSAECGIPVWKPNSKGVPEKAEARQERFVGILNGLDIVGHLSSAGSLADPEAALQARVGDILVRNNALLRQVDPATRLIDALEILKSGVRRLLVRRVAGRSSVSKKFSILYNGKWINNPSTSNLATGASERLSGDTLCCLSREDVVRFLIGCLGALAPLPLSSIATLGAVSREFVAVDCRSAALDAMTARGADPAAVAVVETLAEGKMRVVGDISAFKLWKCDHVSAAWALANLSAGEFALGVEEIAPPLPFHFQIQNVNGKDLRDESCISDFYSSSSSSPRHHQTPAQRRQAKRFSTKSRDFVNLYFDNCGNSTADKSLQPRSSFRARNAPLTCRPENSLAAVMAQMLAHRATHIWVTQRCSSDSGNGGDGQDEEFLVGVVSYADIISAVTRPS